MFVKRRKALPNYTNGQENGNDHNVKRFCLQHQNCNGISDQVFVLIFLVNIYILCIKEKYVLQYESKVMDTVKLNNETVTIFE